MYIQESQGNRAIACAFCVQKIQNYEVEIFMSQPSKIKLYQIWLFGILLGEPCFWGCIAGKTRNTSLHMTIVV